MKNFKFYLGTIFCVTLMMSFSLKKEKNIDLEFIKMKIPIENIDEQGWGSWNTTDCLKGLDFRVKNDGYNKYAKKYKWNIEFRNRYREKIHLNYVMVSPSRKQEIKRSDKAKYRVHIDGNSGTYKVTYSNLVNSNSSVYVYINKIRIGAKDYGYDYYNCDK
ncbi:hypothetical protein MC378_03000 [Polaribacter sp. MSW13]|uniref:Uncharacterized protein n=1 Tax=Polaribacter marinus TaxID=2916838 RepID=A0A9X1VRC9_9FLAO|nr:hypothetical protein [Polaribacter marinus]MCI2228121.1 hypothetical protein [Polaribacter marinus]